MLRPRKLLVTYGLFTKHEVNGQRSRLVIACLWTPTACQPTTTLTEKDRSQYPAILHEQA